MFHKKKEKTVEMNEDDRAYVSTFPSKVDVLIEMNHFPELADQLKELRFLVENLSVSPKEKVISQDKQIVNALSDMRVELLKGKDSQKVASQIEGVRVLLAERKGLYFQN